MNRKAEQQLKTGIGIKFLIVTALLLAIGNVFAEEALWVDVRSDAEYEEDHIAGATHIPHTEIATEIAALKLDKTAPIILFCGSGGRAGIARETLESLGYSNLRNVGGIDDSRELMAEE